MRFILFLLFLPFFLLSQNVGIDYYLPGETFDESIISPEDYLGWQIGEWHITHDQLRGYCMALAEQSPKVTYYEYARSHEERPLFYLTITSTKNHGRLNDIRNEQMAMCDPDQADGVNLDEKPIIVYQGFSIHGNEPSGGNAAPLLAYHLAAGQGEEVEKLLDKSVVLLDPCYNPDGFHRFSTWVNMHKSKNLNPDPNGREFNEVWPRGRTNHYWFDLNRDWLPVQHPESRGRIQEFHHWKPTILTDHHEMGKHRTFFFQPGVPSRTNHLTPHENQHLTGEIGKYHAANLDAIGSFYYSKEGFDDFYYGKGSTYPDAMGSIGILFEQGSSRGHLQETDNGILSFPFTIRNQLQTALSTQKAAMDLRVELLTYQRDFFKKNKKEAKGGFVFSPKGDKQIIRPFLEILHQHEIKVFELANDLKVKKQNFPKGEGLYVPLDQPQYRLIQSLFEENKKFKDSLFYDVSTMNFAAAFNLNYAYAKRMSNADLGRLHQVDYLSQKSVLDKSQLAYLLPWSDFFAPQALYYLLKNGLRVRVAEKPFIIDNQEFSSGTLMIPVKGQDMEEQFVHDIILEAQLLSSINFVPVKSGLATKGIDLGSPKISNIQKPEVLLLVGSGASSYGVGEVWYLLDRHYDIPVSLVEMDRFKTMNTNRYNTLVLADGSYTEASKKIKDFVSRGGNLITIGRATRWLNSSGIVKFDMKPNVKPDTLKKRLPYRQIEGDLRKHNIGGAIVGANMDLSHPLTFGYTEPEIPLFKNNTNMLKLPKNQYATPLQYTSNPLIAGYMSQENQDQLANCAAVVVGKHGSGKVIAFADNPVFRGYWYGTNKLFANALFFSDLISRQAAE